MRLWFSARTRMVVAIAFVVLLPLQQLLAANPAVFGNGRQPTAVPSAGIRDVALQDNGSMRGQVVDAQGNPCPEIALRFTRSSDQAPAAVAQTDRQGRFEASGLTGGIYRIETPAGVVVYRLWAPDTAPPTAAKSALIVQGDPTMRGHMGGMGWFGLALVAAGVAAAVALPIILDDDDAS